MTKKQKASLRWWVKWIIIVSLGAAALYGCTQMDYRSKGQILDAGGSIRVQIRKPHPRTYGDRCKLIINLGNGDVVACFAICKEICQ